jgi:hypothetical protein
MKYRNHHGQALNRGNGGTLLGLHTGSMQIAFAKLSAEASVCILPGTVLNPPANRCCEALSKGSSY